MKTVQKLYLLSLCITLLLSFQKTTFAHTTHYEKFHLPKIDIINILNNHIVKPVQTNIALNAEITFACADIKYKNGELKFCECGDAVYMSFRPAWINLNNKKQWLTAPYWGFFWHYLHQFNLPIWLIGDTGPNNALALDEFSNIGGRYAKNFIDLKKDIHFKKLCINKIIHSEKITDYKGIIVYRSYSVANRDDTSIKEFKKNHSEFLFINHATRDIIKRKNATYQAFINANLKQYVPISYVYPTLYSPDLAESIASKFLTNFLVIKPEYSSLGYGINIVEKNNLDTLLKLILKDNKKIKSNTHRCFSYWRNSKANSFVVQEYAPSKLLIKDAKQYDPTMRIVFFMHHNQGKITITVIGGFWKIPVKPLDDKNATLTEKHVTIAHAGDYYTGMLCEQKDWKIIENALYDLLPQLYETVLVQNIQKKDYLQN